VRKINRLEVKKVKRKLGEKRSSDLFDFSILLNSC
jgi:hypothetical protein